MYAFPNACDNRAILISASHPDRDARLQSAGVNLRPSDDAEVKKLLIRSERINQ